MDYRALRLHFTSMSNQSLSVEGRQQVNKASVAKNWTFVNADLEVAVESLYVGMILSISVDVEPSVAAGARKDIGSRIDAASLCPPNHPDKTILHYQFKTSVDHIQTAENWRN
jgi:hypothetical protein